MFELTLARYSCIVFLHCLLFNFQGPGPFSQRRLTILPSLYRSVNTSTPFFFSPFYHLSGRLFLSCATPLLPNCRMPFRRKETPPDAFILHSRSPGAPPKAFKLQPQLRRSYGTVWTRLRYFLQSDKKQRILPVKTKEKRACL